MDLLKAKELLDKVLKKSRIHFYKPIQIVEILYRDRISKDIDLKTLETYRTKSKKWRDDISLPLLGRVCTSSAKFQDDIFNVITTEVFSEIGKYNREHSGAVEAYIYNSFIKKYYQLNHALDYCLKSTRETFNIKKFINSFWDESGLKRSLDKIYEIIVYSLFFYINRNIGIEG